MATKKAPARKPAAKASKRAVKIQPGQQRVRVFRSTADDLWYAERRAANGMLVHRSHGYAKKGRAEQYGRKLAEPATFVLEESLPL